MANNNDELDKKILEEEQTENQTDKSAESNSDVVEETNDKNEKTKTKQSKKVDKKKKADKKDVQIEELTDKYTRLMAEFENFRKRTDKEKSAMYEVGAKSVVEKILLTVDNFERGLSTISEEEKETPFVDGMDKIYKQLLLSLEEAGVKPIEAVGEQFDPELHNAVMHMEDEELGENVIVEEFQKGYMYRESVVRHSMVKVAN